MLLHTCCGPCASVVGPYFREQGLEPVLFYYNPNIQPLAEYEKRRQGVLTLGQALQFSVLLSEAYNPFPFLQHALQHPKERCSYCYADRLQKTALEAKQMSIHQFSTTLLVSPFQDRDRILELGHKIALQHGLEFLAPDLRTNYPEARTNAMSLGLYRQNYCGCLLSEYERRYPEKEILS
jgi:hypothetical protein